ncbi:MAG: universal stress protein [Magnetococcales bacterium]|nr:universal stress protein [Magnetococcales bacterium]
MQTPRCILALVTLDQAGERVAQRAIRFAGRDQLILATIVEIGTDREFDLNPPSGSRNLFEELVTQAAMRLDAMARKLDCEVQIRVEIAQGRGTSLALAKSVGADVVVVGSQATFNLVDPPFWYQLLTGHPVSVEVLVIPDPMTADFRRWLRLWKSWPSTVLF